MDRYSSSRYAPTSQDYRSKSPFGRPTSSMSNSSTNLRVDSNAFDALNQSLGRHDASFVRDLNTSGSSMNDTIPGRYNPVSKKQTTFDMSNNKWNSSGNKSDLKNRSYDMNNNASFGCADSDSSDAELSKPKAYTSSYTTTYSSPLFDPVTGNRSNNYKTESKGFEYSAAHKTGGTSLEDYDDVECASSSTSGSVYSNNNDRIVLGLPARSEDVADARAWTHEDSDQDFESVSQCSDDSLAKYGNCGTFMVEDDDVVNDSANLEHVNSLTTGQCMINSIACDDDELFHGARAGNQSPTLNMTSTSASTRGVVSGVAGATIHESPSTFDLIDEENAVKFVSTCRVTDSEAVRAVDWHPSGQFFAVGSNSKLLRVFRVGGSAAAGSTTQDSNNNVTNSFETPPEVIYRRPRYHKGSVYCLSWNKLGNLLATGSNDKCIKLASFNASSGTFEDCESIISAHDGTVRDLCFMDDLTNGSSVLLSAGAGNCRIYVTDCETATSFLSLSGHSRPIHTLYTWGGATLVSGSEDRTIRMWDLRSRDCYNLISCPTISRNKSGGAVTAVAVDPSGRLLVSGHEDSTCMLYDIRAGRVIQTFQPHTADVRTIRFSSKAYYLLTGGFDSRLVLSNLQGDLTQPIQSVEVARHDDKVISARWHPTDFSFLTASADKTAALWSLQDNTPILSG